MPRPTTRDCGCSFRGKLTLPERRAPASRLGFETPEDLVNQPFQTGAPPPALFDTLELLDAIYRASGEGRRIECRIG